MLADAQAAVTERLTDKARHQPTLNAIMAGAVVLRHQTAAAERSTARQYFQRLGS